MHQLGELCFGLACAAAVTFMYIGVLNVLSVCFPERPRKAGGK